MKEVLKYLRALENENSNLKQKLKITLYEKIELLTKLRTGSVMRLRLATEKEIENLKYMYADKITDLEMENFKLKEYVGKYSGLYAWEILNVYKFSEIYKLEDLGLKRPPQSWGYTHFNMTTYRAYVDLKEKKNLEQIKKMEVVKSLIYP